MEAKPRIDPRLAFLCLLAVGATLPLVARAELLGPGKYYGRIVVDQWGGMHLANGANVKWIAASLRKAVAPFAGQAVVVEVSRIGGAWNGHIQAITAIRPCKPDQSGATNLKINFYPRKWQTALGDRVVFGLEVRYAGGKPTQFFPAKLHVAMVRKANGKETRSTGHPSVVTVIGLGKDTIDGTEAVADAFPLRSTDGHFATESAFVYSRVLSRQLPAGAFQAWVSYGRVSSRLITFRVLKRVEARRGTQIAAVRSLWRACRYGDHETARACLDMEAVSRKGALAPPRAIALHDVLSKTHSFGKNLGWAIREDGVTVEAKSFNLMYQLSKQPDKTWLITRVKKVSRAKE